MSQRSSRSKSRSPVAAPSAEIRQPLGTRIIRGVFQWPRLVRIVIVAVFALSVTFALSPIIDAVYLRYFFSEGTRVLPSLAAVSAGLVMYALGWVLVIGTVGEQPRERSAVLWYGVVGLLAAALAAVMLVSGWMTGNAPTI